MRRHNPGFRATPQWGLIQTWARDQRGIKIGIVGTPAAYGQYVFYGENLSNEVRHLGEPGPHGARGPRPVSDRPALRRAAAGMATGRPGAPLERQDPCLNGDALP